jgi:hypothetical protein
LRSARVDGHLNLVLLQQAKEYFQGMVGVADGEDAQFG